MKWYLKVLNQYADFKGRARRKEYWMYSLITLIITIFAIILDNLLGIAHPLLGYGPIYSLYVLATLVPGIALSVRRLHDVGKSGWLLLIIFIPILGAIWLLVLAFQDSEPGENEYGPNPKEINASDDQILDADLV